MSESTDEMEGIAIIETASFVDDVLGDHHIYPQRKREPGLEPTDVRTKSEGTEFERNRYIGRSNPDQASYYQVSIEEPLETPVQVNSIRAPPLFPDRQFPGRTLKMNIGSVENARKLYDALGAAFDEYDRHEKAGENA